MSPHLATFLYAGLIAGLFVLTRDRKARTSAAMWIPLAWIWLASSRSVVEWLAVLGLATLPTEAEVYAEGSLPGRAVQMVLMAGALALLVGRRRLAGVLRANPVVVIFFAYAAMSVTWSDYGDITLRRWFRAMGDPLMVLVVLTEANPTAAIKRLLVTAGFLLIPPSVLLIKYYPDIGRTYNRWTWTMMVTGVTTHKNGLGIICQIYGVVFCWGFLNAWWSTEARSRRRGLLAYGVALAMVMWLFWRAGSVTAQSCFLLGCFFLFLAKGGALGRKPPLLHALVAALILIPAAVLFLGIASSALEAMGRDPTLTGRTEIWRRVLAVSGDPLLGTGFDSFWLGARLRALQSWYEGLNSTHNAYLEIFVTLGGIGVMLLVGLILVGYRNITAAYERDASHGALAMAQFIAVIVGSFTEAVFKPGGLPWIVLLLVTLRPPNPVAGASIGALKPRALEDEAADWHAAGAAAAGPRVRPHVRVSRARLPAGGSRCDRPRPVTTKTRDRGQLCS